MILSNAHTHTTYCDGKTPIGGMIAAAKRLDFTSLGFSSHAHQPFDFDYCMSEENQQAYLRELRALQLSEKTLKLWVGLERDALSDADRAPYDYIIGSTHYLREPLDGEYIAVDGNVPLLRRALDERYHGDGLALARDYYALEAGYIADYRPDIIGHFDLVRLYAGQLGLFDEQSPAYQAIAMAALEKAFAGCQLMEVNTGGMARASWLKSPYPASFLLPLWREMGGRVILTSDCHDCRYLNSRFEQTARELKTLGFETVTVLGDGDELFTQQEI